MTLEKHQQILQTKVTKAYEKAPQKAHQKAPQRKHLEESSRVLERRSIS